MDIDISKAETDRDFNESLDPVRSLVHLLFNATIMNETMSQFEIDMEKMLLGKLSKKQIYTAMAVLQEIYGLVQNKVPRGRLIEASNDFYTLIQLDFGIKNYPVIETIDEIAAKTKALESLLEVSLIKILKDQSSQKKNKLDNFYEQLNVEIFALNHTSKEFELLSRYVKNTHINSHLYPFDIEIQQIFRVTRKEEDYRYEPFKKFDNRRLLWHGSRITNFAGILSHGLKIAPLGVPHGSYMYGKGIYFADVVSRSTPFCLTSPSNNIGLMLLCEVALGNTMDILAPTYITKLTRSNHSVKGVGRTFPNPSETITTEAGVNIPIGKLITDPNIQTERRYNEYIVYDEAQVQIKYLFQMKFHYNENVSK